MSLGREHLRVSVSSYTARSFDLLFLFLGRHYCCLLGGTTASSLVALLLPL